MTRHPFRWQHLAIVLAIYTASNTLGVGIYGYSYNVFASGSGQSPSSFQLGFSGDFASNGSSSAYQTSEVFRGGTTTFIDPPATTLVAEASGSSSASQGDISAAGSFLFLNIFVDAPALFTLTVAHSGNGLAGISSGWSADPSQVALFSDGSLNGVLAPGAYTIFGSSVSLSDKFSGDFGTWFFSLVLDESTTLPPTFPSGSPANVPDGGSTVAFMLLSSLVLIGLRRLL